MNDLELQSWRYAWLAKGRSPAAFANMKREVVRSIEWLGHPIETATRQELVRARAIFAVLYDTGMRRSELARLELDDVDLDSRRILIRERSIRHSLLEQTASVLGAWRSMRYASTRSTTHRNCAGDPLSPDEVAPIAYRRPA